MEKEADRIAKIFVVGLDGGSYKLLKRLAAEGYMPFFASVLEEGVSGELRSVLPPSTPTAWSTFLTGQNPGRHGVFEFFAYENMAAPLRVVNSLSLRDSDTLWAVMGRAGRRVGFVNVPMTYPPHPVEGTMITGILTPSVAQRFTYPPDLYQQLKKELGEYMIGVTWRDYSTKEIPRFIQALTRCSLQRRKYVRYLMEHHPWEFFMVVFSETDSLQHALWNFLEGNGKGPLGSETREDILEYYRVLDLIMEELCTIAGEETQVFFISDHGFGPLQKWVHINTWLQQTGFLAFNWKQVYLRRGARRLRGLLRRVDRFNWRKKLFAKEGYRTDILSCIDWDRTKAFSVLSGEQGIRINLRGREPKGIVSPGEEYETLRDLIIARLQRLKDPQTGEAVGDFVKKREEVYKGPHVSQAPDIVFLLREGNCISDVFPASKIFEPTDWQFGTGTHRLQGLFAAKGPGIKRNERIEGAGLEDLLPTFLYSLGIPIPANLDGKALDDIYQEGVLSARSPTFVETVHEDQAEMDGYSNQEEQKVIERLRGLGYIE